MILFGLCTLNAKWKQYANYKDQNFEMNKWINVFNDFYVCQIKNHRRKQNYVKSNGGERVQKFADFLVATSSPPLLFDVSLNQLPKLLQSLRTVGSGMLERQSYLKIIGKIKVSKCFETKVIFWRESLGENIVNKIWRNI